MYRATYRICVYQISNSYLKTWRDKSSEKIPVAGSSAEIPLLSVCGHQGATNFPAMTKISTIEDTCYMRTNNCWGHKWRKITWAHFFVWRCLLDIYIYQVSNWYLKTCTKTLENFHWLGALLTTISEYFLSARGPKIGQPWPKSVGINTRTI